MSLFPVGTCNSSPSPGSTVPSHEANAEATFRVAFLLQPVCVGVSSRLPVTEPYSWAARQLSQQTPRTWNFSEDLRLAEGKAWCQRERELVSQEGISHTSDHLSDHLPGDWKPGSDGSVMGRATPWPGLLRCASSCSLFNPEPHVRTLKTDLGGII